MTIAAKLLHLFVPRHTNNHKAKLLHTSSLFVISTLLVLYQVGLQLVLNKSDSKILGYASNIPPDSVVSIVNQKRAENGLPVLSTNSQLIVAAQAKASDMLAKDYWAHVSPDGTEPWYFITSAGYRYRYAGENLARDFADPGSAVEAWMASPSHRDNILSSKYRETGVAVIEGDLAGVDSTIIVQLFGTALSESGEIQIAEAKVEATPVPTKKPVITATPVPDLSPTNAPTATLMPTISQIPFETPDQRIASAPVSIVSNEPENGIKSLFSPFDATRAMSLVTIIVLGVVMAIDAFIVSRKKITRLSGRNFAHLAFLGVILSIILIAGAGRIL